MVEVATTKNGSNLGCAHQKAVCNNYNVQLFKHSSATGDLGHGDDGGGDISDPPAEDEITRRPPVVFDAELKDFKPGKQDQLLSRDCKCDLFLLNDIEGAPFKDVFFSLKRPRDWYSWVQGT